MPDSFDGGDTWRSWANMRNKNNKDASALEERFISEEVQVEEIDVDRAFKGKRRRHHGSQRHPLQDPLVGDPLH
jgi:hypothetical protein